MCLIVIILYFDQWDQNQQFTWPPHTQCTAIRAHCSTVADDDDDDKHHDKQTKHTERCRLHITHSFLWIVDDSSTR